MTKKVKLNEVWADNPYGADYYYKLLQKYMGAFGQQLGIEKFKDAVESGVRKGIADETEVRKGMVKYGNIIC